MIDYLGTLDDWSPLYVFYHIGEMIREGLQDQLQETGLFWASIYRPLWVKGNVSHKKAALIQLRCALLQGRFGTQYLRLSEDSREKFRKEKEQVFQDVEKVVDADKKIPQTLIDLYVGGEPPNRLSDLVRQQAAYSFCRDEEIQVLKTNLLPDFPKFPDLDGKYESSLSDLEKLQILYRILDKEPTSWGFPLGVWYHALEKRGLDKKTIKELINREEKKQGAAPLQNEERFDEFWGKASEAESSSTHEKFKDRFLEEMCLLIHQKFDELKRTGGDERELEIELCELMHGFFGIFGTKPSLEHIQSISDLIGEKFSLEETKVEEEKASPIQTQVVKYSRAPGLRNKGSSCYANAVFQLLYSITFFKNYMCFLAEQAETLKKWNLVGKKLRLVEAIATLFNKMEKGETTDVERIISIVYPDQSLSFNRVNNWQFSIRRHQDAHELFEKILGVCEQELSTSENKLILNPFRIFNYSTVDLKEEEEGTNSKFEVKNRSSFNVVESHIGPPTIEDIAMQQFVQKDEREAKQDGETIGSLSYYTPFISYPIVMLNQIKRFQVLSPNPPKVEVKKNFESFVFHEWLDLGNCSCFAPESYAKVKQLDEENSRKLKDYMLESDEEYLPLKELREGDTGHRLNVSLKPSTGSMLPQTCNDGGRWEISVPKKQMLFSKWPTLAGFYSLQSVLPHTGGTEVGHYIAYVKNRQEGKEERWIKYDDAVRQDESWEDMKGEGLYGYDSDRTDRGKVDKDLAAVGYLLAYVREDTVKDIIEIAQRIRVVKKNDPGYLPQGAGKNTVLSHPNIRDDEIKKGKDYKSEVMSQRSLDTSLWEQEHIDSLNYGGGSIYLDPNEYDYYDDPSQIEDSDYDSDYDCSPFIDDNEVLNNNTEKSGSGDEEFDDETKKSEVSIPAN
jgi:hypothetical protein